MGILDSLVVETPLKVEVDSTAKAGSFQIDTGLHKLTIDVAYLDTQFGSNVLVVTFKDCPFSETLYITDVNGNHMVKPRNGKGDPYPCKGFAMANTLCLLAAGVPFAPDKLTVENKFVDVYDFTLKARAPTSKEVIMDLSGKDIWVGVHHIIKNKSKNIDGKWVLQPEEKNYNVVDKFFQKVD